MNNIKAASSRAKNAKTAICKPKPCQWQKYMNVPATLRRFALLPAKLAASATLFPYFLNALPDEAGPLYTISVRDKVVQAKGSAVHPFLLQKTCRRQA